MDTIPLPTCRGTEEEKCFGVVLSLMCLKCVDEDSPSQEHRHTHTHTHTHIYSLSTVTSFGNMGDPVTLKQKYKNKVCRYKNRIEHTEITNVLCSYSDLNYCDALDFLEGLLLIKGSKNAFTKMYMHLLVQLY